jgi:hypothetical protein
VLECVDSTESRLADEGDKLRCSDTGEAERDRGGDVSIGVAGRDGGGDVSIGVAGRDGGGDVSIGVAGRDGGGDVSIGVAGRDGGGDVSIGVAGRDGSGTPDAPPGSAPIPVGRGSRGPPPRIDRTTLVAIWPGVSGGLFPSFSGGLPRHAPPRHSQCLL